MRTQAERVSSLHERMEARRRMLDRRKTGALRMLAAGMAACLVLVICAASAAYPGGTAGPYSGATMLLENAGAYVLVALAAFLVGAAVTLICLRQQRNTGNNQAKQSKEEGKEETEETT